MSDESGGEGWDYTSDKTFVLALYCVTNGSGRSAGGTRQVMGVTFILINVLTRCQDLFSQRHYRTRLLRHQSKDRATPDSHRCIVRINCPYMKGTSAAL